MRKLSELYFGDFEGRDEFVHLEYFLNSFVLPNSVRFNQLTNDKKFIIVGRKGAGKTAAQRYLANEKENEGYKARSFSFFDDLRDHDFNTLSKSQHMSVAEMVHLNGDNDALQSIYNFVDIWKVMIWRFIASMIDESDSLFKRYVFAGRSSERLTLFENIEPLGLLSGMPKKAIELANRKLDANHKIAIGDYLSGAAELFCEEKPVAKAYIFLDELVVSKLDRKDDEVKLRMALIRDLLRASRDMNRFFAENQFDIHLVCSLRPEIKKFLEELDSEIGKITISKSVNLEWEASEILDVLEHKIKYSADGSEEEIDFSTFFPEEISFAQGSAGARKTMSREEFIKLDTWLRPRDVVSLLTAIQNNYPIESKITAEMLSASMSAYSENCLKEIEDELSVTYSADVLKDAWARVSRKAYSDYAYFREIVLKSFQNDENALIFAQDLYRAGVIVLYDPKSEEAGARYYAFHRRNSQFDSGAQIRVHQGLWNAFNVA